MILLPQSLEAGITGMYCHVQLQRGGLHPDFTVEEAEPVSISSEL